MLRAVAAALLAGGATATVTYRMLRGQDDQGF